MADDTQQIDFDVLAELLHNEYPGTDPDSIDLDELRYLVQSLDLDEEAYEDLDDADLDRIHGHWVETRQAEEYGLIDEEDEGDEGDEGDDGDEEVDDQDDEDGDQDESEFEDGDFDSDK